MRQHPLLTIVISFFFLLCSSSYSHANNLYVNDLKNDISDFNYFFGECITSTKGMSCKGLETSTGAAGISKLSYPNMKCISFDADNTNGTPQIIFSDSLLDQRVFASFKSGTSIKVYLIEHQGESYWNTGILAPTSKANLQFCKETNRISIYIDDKLTWENISVYPSFEHAGFYVEPGTILTNFKIVDNLPITDLNVSLFKQTDGAWGGGEYDSASLWNARDPRIHSWGCAMTSAAMVFTYHGIKKLPDGSALNPGTLNAWLKSQPDGYVGAGATNWLALQRLSKQAKAINTITTFDALQYKRSGFDKNQLTADIKNNIPGILQVPGHFIVAKGITDDSFSINDPFYNRQTLKDGYANSFISLGRYVPSFTDLSYIMISTDSESDIKVYDRNGNELVSNFLKVLLLTQKIIVKPLLL